MHDNTAQNLFRCVALRTATNFETAGAILSPADIDQLFAQYDLHYLSEVMNYPGVLNTDPDIYEKITLSQRYGKVIDGHAPGLRGEAARQYIAAGISTDTNVLRLTKHSIN
jgi:adenine deaminase